MLSWIDFAMGVVVVSVWYLIIQVMFSTLTWRYEKHTQIADACARIDNAFEARDNE